MFSIPQQILTIIAAIAASLSALTILIVFWRRAYRRKKISRDQEKAISQAKLHAIENENNGLLEVLDENIQITNKKNTKKRIRSAEINRILRRVETLIARSELKEAERLLIEIIADDDNKKAHSFLADVYFRQNLHSKARLLAEHTLELDPEDILANTVLGQILIIREELDEAIQIYQKLLKLDPKKSAHHFTLAKILIVKGKNDQARENLEIALSLAPRNREILLTLANFLRHNNTRAEYVSFLNKATEIFPYDEEIKKLRHEAGIESS